MTTPHITVIKQPDATYYGVATNNVVHVTFKDRARAEAEVAYVKRVTVQCRCCGTFHLDRICPKCQQTTPHLAVIKGAKA